MNINFNLNNNLIQDLKIVQHNILHWTKDRSTELANYYRQENLDIILLNSTNIINNNIINIYNYNIIQKNALNERNTGIAVGIKKKY